MRKNKPTNDMVDKHMTDFKQKAAIRRQWPFFTIFTSVAQDFTEHLLLQAQLFCDYILLFLH